MIFLTAIQEAALILIGYFDGGTDEMHHPFKN
jgi:hypothetical protein